MRLVLASASPRRAALLRAAGIAFDPHPALVDETVAPGEPAEAYARRMAEAKARAGAASLPGRAVLAADTVVVLDGSILGKPRDDEEARAMLRRLSGRRHTVLTAVCLIHGACRTEIETTRVDMAPMAEADIDWYVRSGEPMDKAGAYAAQGRASRWITRIEGSYSNVVGLPVALVCRMCTSAGVLIS